MTALLEYLSWTSHFTIFGGVLPLYIQGWEERSSLLLLTHALSLRQSPSTCNVDFWYVYNCRMQNWSHSMDIIKEGSEHLH